MRVRPLAGLHGFDGGLQWSSARLGTRQHAASVQPSQNVQYYPAKVRYLAWST